MIERHAAIVERFPVWLLENGHAESDWEGWGRLNARLGDQLELVGDDVFCTNPAIIQQGIERNMANSSLIKLNEIGTVSETLEAMRLCRKAGWRQLVSHRAGETGDTLIADLAVGTEGGHLKSGARGGAGREVQPADRDRGQAPLPYGLG